MIASTAAQDFSSVRKKAKDTPLFILDRGKVDSVLLGYGQFEQMYMRLQELETELLVLQRSQELREKPNRAVPWSHPADRQGLIHMPNRAAVQYEITFHSDAVLGLPNLRLSTL